MRLELEISPLDLDLTLGCGQTFRWRRQIDDSWRGVLGNQLVTLRKVAGTVVADISPGARDAHLLVEQLLRSNDNIAKIQRRLRQDPVLAPGISRLKGLRIVKLDEWECLVSFILATYANIPRIMKMVEAVASAYGPRIAPGVHAFPSRKALTKASVGELANLGLGYRAKYVHKACRSIDDSAMRDLMRSPFENLRAELIELPGVGEKVADCVALFGFGRLESFPIDVWMQRALKRLYGQTGSYGKLRHFASNRFGESAGYAQEYIYYNERMRGRTGACVFLEK